MAIAGLTLIGESINDSIPSTKAMFDARDMEGVKALARQQDDGGAAYIDVNVGMRSADFMAEIVRAVQSVTAKPLSIDTPDAALAAAGLEAYDPDRAGGQWPILNSISLLRLEMFQLYTRQPFIPILLATEHLVDGQPKACATSIDIHKATRKLVRAARESGHEIPLEYCIADPGIAPIASDTDGTTPRVLDAIKLIHDDAELIGIHVSVGMSNFTVMLPPRRADGSPVKSALESAFLTRALPLGLDTIIGSVKRRYELLPPHHPALACLDDMVQLPGAEAIMRVQAFYR